MVSWPEIDTVLLDMDGTLIDLHYDNTLWNERLPEAYAHIHSMAADAAREHLFTHMRRTRSSIDFYCLDHWADFTQMDIDALHSELAHLITYRANAEAFIAKVRDGGRRAVLVTNAHPKSLAVKDSQTHLTAALDADFSAHHFGVPKEDQAFWPTLARHEPFDPERTLMIDDNVSVLQSARAHGIKHLLCVSQPDSAQPARSNLGFPAFNDFAEIMPP